MGGGARTKDQVGQVMTAPSYDDSMSSLSPSTTLFLMESSMAAEHQASLGLKEPPHQHQGWSPCPKKSKDDLAKMEDDLRSKEDNLKVGRSSLRKGEDVPRKPLAGMISKKFLETPGQEPVSCLWDSQDRREEDYPEFSILSPDTLSSMIQASHVTDDLGTLSEVLTVLEMHDETSVTDDPRHPRDTYWMKSQISIR